MTISRDTIAGAFILLIIAAVIIGGIYCIYIIYFSQYNKLINLNNKMETFIFPGQVKTRILNAEEAMAIKPSPAADITFSVSEPQLTEAGKLAVELVLINPGGDIDLVVSPGGGAFPQMSGTPFRADILSMNQGVVSYLGELLPPEAPLPILISIPAQSRVAFKEEIDLSLYSWKGAPEVSLKWAFYYYKQPVVEGVVKVKLPEKSVLGSK